MNGRTETRRLSAAQMARYADWFENAKRLRALTSELEALSLDLARSSEDRGAERHEGSIEWNHTLIPRQRLMLSDAVAS